MKGSVINANCPECDTLMTTNYPDKELSEKPDILNEAYQTINGDRLDSYGKPEDSFQIISEFWSTYIRHKFGIEIILDPLDIGHLMSLFKHARMLGQKPNRDNYVDAVGYLAIAADRLIRWSQPLHKKKL
jgi:hypothetical protein